MVETCERCNVLRADMNSACVEARAVLQDRSERVRLGESTPTHRLALFKEAKNRWDAAVSEFETHRASHY